MSDKLLPCPHCGGEATAELTLPECAVEYVWMVWCCASMEGYDTEEQAIAAWNVRYTEKKVG